MKSSLKPAATVIIAKRIPASTAFNKCNYQLLMVKRSSTARFFPGAHVFPGGVLENSDMDPKWNTLVKNFQQTECVADDKGKTDTPEFNFRIGAIREIFEESNVLIASKSDKNLTIEDMIYWRKAVIGNSEKFLEMFETTKMAPAAEELHLFDHWITPTAEKYRYNTLFYVTEYKDSQFTPAQDNKETTAIDWLAPDTILDEYEKGRVLLAPPTWYLIRELARYLTIDSLLSTAKNKKVVTKFPRIVKQDEIPDSISKVPKGKQLMFSVLLPGDALHKNNKESPARNRILVTADASEPSFDTWRYILESTEPRAAL